MSARRHLLLVAVLACIALASLADARPGFYDYWKAGTKRKRSGSTLPQGRESTSNQRAAPRKTAPESGPEPWTSSWFSDPKLVEEHLAAMTQTIRKPLIGERFPLPRGGGFACSRRDGGPGAPGLLLSIECHGPDLGGERRNEFYAPSEEAPATLERVRWIIVARDTVASDRWRAVMLALGDSLSRAAGAPEAVHADSMGAACDLDGYTATMRLHASAARMDSFEIRCESDRLRGDRAANP
ncbi:MAG TPA: hypothetical protein VFP58_12845 [Candidatus Eisenbacteria bacterium]|nr:hypothetical protein [Candidatus Eisenbacteria bacterium]